MGPEPMQSAPGRTLLVISSTAQCGNRDAVHKDGGVGGGGGGGVLSQSLSRDDEKRSNSQT